TGSAGIQWGAIGCELRRFKWVGVAVARLPDTEEATGSIPVRSTTAKAPANQRGPSLLPVPGLLTRLTERPSTDDSGGTAAQRRLVGVGGNQTQGARLAPRGQGA